MVPVLHHESGKPAIVVAMPVAQDEPVKALRIDIEQREIAVDDLGRIAEIEEVLRFGTLSLLFEMQRQTPFAGERRHWPTADRTDMLDQNVAMCRLGQEALVV